MSRFLSALCCTAAMLAAVPAASARSAGAFPSPSPSASAQVLQEEADDVDPAPPIRSASVQTFYTNASYGPGNVRVGQVIPRFDSLRIGDSYVRLSFPRYAWTDGGAYGISDAQIIYLTSLSHGGSTRFAVGGTFYIPSASSPQLGIGTWGLGPAAGLIHFDRVAGLATGFLLQSIFSFAGPSTRPKQRVVALQPLVVKQLGAGWSLRSADAQWATDFTRGSTIVPVSLGIGKLFPVGAQVLNVVVADVVTVIHANAPAAPKNTWKLTIIIMDPRRRLGP
ncbi:MAG TPA: hypothetical protein VKB39_10750 [Candidatus Baltobacteraceae bacterium]|nr:hypothetical protein [Candidatus Baltobacteraceae bacterium]